MSPAAIGSVPQALSCQVTCSSFHISWINGHILTKLVTINHYKVNVKMMTIGRSLIRRSRSVITEQKPCEYSSEDINQTLQIYFLWPGHTLIRVWRSWSHKSKVTEDIFPSCDEQGGSWTGLEVGKMKCRYSTFPYSPFPPSLSFVSHPWTRVPSANPATRSGLAAALTDVFWCVLS